MLIIPELHRVEQSLAYLIALLCASHANGANPEQLTI